MYKPENIESFFEFIKIKISNDFVFIVWNIGSIPTYDIIVNDPI